MIVLDTNVLSEALRVRPSQLVLDWMGRLTDACTTAISAGELLVGARRLPSGGRRDGLVQAIEQALTAFAGRILPYDDSAARVYAQMQESRRRAGIPLSVEDGMIAAICSARDGTLATRNVKDFRGLDITLIDPWSAGT